MGIADRQSSKSGGGYVGGFLQLFDWNGKSRKKLFSNKSDLPEGSKEGKKSDGNLPMTRLRLMEEDENGGSSIKGSSDYSCASSVTDDEGYGARAPGVVARLMGLDSLPTSITAESYSTPFIDSCSLREASYHGRTPVFHNEHQIVHSSNQLPKVEGFSRNLGECMPQKMQSRPIERFQTEILPPKSAKSIPSTHHKLLSPIKSSGFIPSKNAAHIMEAAAKIIEPGTQTTTKGKMPSIGSTSIPLKVRDFKEKIEAAQRPPRLPEASRKIVESSSSKYSKGQSFTKSWNDSEGIPQLRASTDSEDSSSVGLKNKSKSISLAVQAKVNVQRREGLDLNSSKNLVSKKEHSDVKANQPFKNQPNAQKNTQKKACIQGASSVLRQNNQKQNCLTNKDKLSSKPSVSRQQGRKPLSGDSSIGRNKTSNKAAVNSKVGSRRTSLEATNVEKISSSSTKNAPRKKRSIDREFHFENKGIVDTVFADKDDKPILSNVDRLGQSTWDDNKRNGMDVVSFTFTSPMIKGVPVSQSSSTVERSSVFSVDSCGDRTPADVKKGKLSTLGLNMLGGDALSVLLEQKLRELTYGIGSSYHNSVKTGTAASSASILEDLVSALNAVSTSPGGCNKGSQIGLSTNKFSSSHDPSCFSTDIQMLKMNHKLLEGEAMSKCSSGNSEPGTVSDCRHPSPASVLEPAFSNESCSYSDSADSESSTGNKQCSVQAYEVISLSHPRKFQPVEAEAELSDSACSTSSGTRGVKLENAFSVSGSAQSEKWELEYVREILCNVELMFRDFTLGRVSEIINPHLFDQLENRKPGLRSEVENGCALKRKMVFDCVSECLDLRCRRYAGGSCRTWANGVAIVQRKGWLAEEVCREISGWTSMGDWMVDELVDKDMSSRYGRWLDFEVEAFEVGVELERELLSSLVDEVVTDIILG
ncbi:uncharacterized protein LOC122091821 [Macadamia integrifolia]|uniref:uncharacterized protein LOC122091821 n=1 Tax=Macadamia integrifolia TaxID=60698 RepID=UPI001C4F1444|nr:uncharacterized protein LOC122091821 [Macadamia integrifolia]XP_042517913.1 uncharacterized protein LOC122091821 [Macadamia integrifolia]XP_042517915.1 uncharacterized protein LOC122091821 [Macadamia integrifolia]